MDTPAASEPNPVNRPADSASAVPTDEGAQAGGTPPAEPPAPETWKEWFVANSTLLAFMAAAVAFIIYKQLDPFVILKVVVALGLVIFIHELGHFVAAKWCDVHVETFSIGFGKPIPGCRFRYGETTYKIGWIPLGGYVKMVGEGENADTEEAEEDARSFKNKRVGQRMLIISAGVVMNILLACVCFIIAYSHGVEEKPPIIGLVEAGSPAWQGGIRSEAVFDEIDDLKHPVFDDIRPIVMGTDKGEQVRFVYHYTPDGPRVTCEIVPSREGGALYPTIGVSPASQLTVASSRRKDFTPYRKNSPAAFASPRLESGDKVIACSDPAEPDKVTPLPLDERAEARGKLDFFAFWHRLQDLRGKKMTVRVQRGSATQDIVIEPAYHAVTGMRMQMGRVTARRKDSPAASAKVIAVDGASVAPDTEESGIQTSKSEARDTTGDKIISVTVATSPNELIRWSSDLDKPGETKQGERKIQTRLLDPLKLPYELEKWADGKPADRTVTLVVLRPTAAKEKSETKRVTLELEWDDSAKYSRELPTAMNSPISVPGLGLAYHVVAVVDGVAPDSPAAKAGVQKDDLIKAVRWRTYKNGDDKKRGEEKKSDWEEFKPYQWAIIDQVLQDSDPKKIDIRVERAGGPKELELDTVFDESWPMTDRGIVFQPDARLHKADNLTDALGLGLHRTIRTVRVIYQNLYAMIFGRVSVFTMSGPLTIADVSYNIAIDDIWQFILFIGMINVNLAVINFLPIPVLDGGHMVFLIYEWIRGKPAPEWVLGVAMYTGLALILSLMCFVLYLDLRRLF